MAHAKKVYAKKPPLSKLDCFIYIMIIMLAFVIISPILLLSIPPQIFVDDTVVAFRNGWLSIISYTVFILIISMTMIIGGCTGIKNKQPIFGNKKYNSNVYTPTIKVYPVFSKAFWKNVKLYFIIAKNSTRGFIIALISIFLISAISLPIGLCQRKALDDNNQFTSYNIFNQVSDVHNIDDADKLIIKIRYSGGGRYGSPSWWISQEFVFDNQTYEFSIGNFTMDREDTLEYMIYLKEFFVNGKYELENIEKMNNMFEFENYNDVEMNLVYELFDISQQNTNFNK